MAIVAKAYSLSLIKKEEVAKNTWTFYFNRPDDYDFYPGQYNRVALQIKNPDERGNSRQFTIASSPTEKFLTITTKIGKSEFKRKFLSIKPGEVVSFFGPLGGFYIREEDKTPRVFLAGGIGVNPFRSMIKFVVDNNLHVPTTLIVSFSTIEDIVFYDEFLRIAEENPDIKIIYSISHPLDSDKSWKGEVGRISETLIKKYIPNLQKPQFMIVGPIQMVDDTFDLLQKLQVPEDHIKVEHFTGY